MHIGRLAGARAHTASCFSLAPERHREAAELHGARPVVRRPAVRCTVPPLSPRNGQEPRNRLVTRMLPAGRPALGAGTSLGSQAASSRAHSGCSSARLGSVRSRSRTRAGRADGACAGVRVCLPSSSLYPARISGVAEPRPTIPSCSREAAELHGVRIAVRRPAVRRACAPLSYRNGRRPRSRSPASTRPALGAGIA